jgi:ABC-type transport system substrate-binding protein
MGQAEGGYFMKTGTKRFLAALFAAILAALGAFSGALAEGSARTLTIGFGHALENYAPTTAYETKSTMANLAYETIVQYENGEIVPCLAESWAWNGDGTVLTLNVRKGVKFHDGEPLDAEAMAKNLRWANANPLYGFFKGISLIERVDVIDAYTLTVTYPSLYYAALQDLSSPVQMGIVSPAMLDMEKLDSMNGTAGTGPYAYDHYDTEKDAAIFRKNAEYWGGDAKYDEVIVRNIPTPPLG